MAKTPNDPGNAPRPEARLAKGFRDTEAAEIRQMQAMLDKIRGVYERYGFEPLETPALEYTDALGKFLPDQDRPNAGVFSFQDEDDSERGSPRGAGQSERGSPRGAEQSWMSLRYDLTAPLARYVAQNFASLPKPFRRYATGSVFRNEKPGPGRFRQFTQFDADTVGAESVAADAEMCMLAADTLEALGLKGKYLIKVSNRKVLDGVRQAIGLFNPEHDAKWLTVMRALDKFDRLEREGVRQLLGTGRTDESGDRTQGAGLDSEQIKRLLQLLTLRLHIDAQQENVTALYNPNVSTTMADVPVVRSLTSTIAAVFRHVFEATQGQDVRELELLEDGLRELEQMGELFSAAGYDNGRIIIDPSVVRGLEYYTGPVFEAELTFEVKGDDGKPVRFGSVGGGGRYDDLVARFTGEKVPATGFSIGVSRLQAALTALGTKSDTTPGPVVVLVMDKDQLAHYQMLTQKLRTAGIRAEMYLGSSGMKAQMKYADKRGSPVVVIQGSDERAKGEVTLKDLIEGAKSAAAIKDNKDWKAARPAQVAVPEADLVNEVRKILDRHKV